MATDLFEFMSSNEITAMTITKMEPDGFIVEWRTKESRRDPVVLPTFDECLREMIRVMLREQKLRQFNESQMTDYKAFVHDLDTEIERVMTAK
jgi:hypothetical protein